MEVNMDLVKDEWVATTACYSCLSVGRRLQPLNHLAHLFMTLLGNQGHAIDPDEVFICWECIAVLRKMSMLQWRAQCAQIILRGSKQQIESSKSLSNLSRMKLESINISTDLFVNNLENFSSKEEDIYTQNITNTAAVKNEEVTDDNEHFVYEMEMDFKQNYEEHRDDSDTHESVLGNAVTNQNETSTAEETKEDITFKFMNKVIRTKNPDVNINNFRSCYEEMVLTESDIEKLGSNEKYLYEKDKMKRKRRSRIYNGCLKCERKFETCIDLKRHKTFCHILKEECSGRLECLVCGAGCAGGAALRAHWATHNFVARCRVCGAVPTEKNRRYHAVSHEYLWTCKVCVGLKAVCRSYKEFRYHHHILHSRCVCDYCGRRSKSKSALLHHIRLKHQPPHCQLCRKDFKSTQHLRRHQNLAHPSLIDKAVDPACTYCVECDKQFPSEAKYRLHLTSTQAHNPARVAARKSIVPCPDCGKEFTRKTYMNNHHRQVHRKESKHYCQMCDKFLVSAWSMKKHIQGVHQKIRDPKTKVCEECGRAFQTNAVLIKHIRTHTGERPYKCAHCPAAFTQSSALHSHTRTQHKQA